MRRNYLLMAIAAIGLAGSLAPALVSPAAAQQAMQSYLPRRLSTSDVDILRQEAAKLGPKGPKEESWKNPKTGHSGTVTFRKEYQQSGMTCRSFGYTFHTGTSSDGLPYKLNWCEKSPGDWVIAN